MNIVSGASSATRAVRRGMIAVVLLACSGCAMQPTTELRRPGADQPLAGLIAQAQADWRKGKDRQQRHTAAQRAVQQKDSDDSEDSEDTVSLGLESIVVTGSLISDQNMITNVQEAGVDEGDIVKKLGNLLMVLRQGRLHVIDTGTRAQPRLAHLATHTVVTGAEADDLWYDEILLFDGGAILLGYNHEVGAAELFVFTLNAAGVLTRQGRWRIDVADDYFSGYDVGARVRGDTLLLGLSMSVDALLADHWPRAVPLDDAGTPDPSRAVDLLPRGELWMLDDLHDEPRLQMALACRLDTLLARGFGCRGTSVIANVEAVRYTGATGTWVVDHAWHAHAYRHVKVDTQDGWWSPDPGDWPWNNEVPTSHYRSRVIELDMEGGLAPQVTALPGKVDDRFNLRETPQGLHLLTRSWAASTGHEWQLHFIPRAGDGAAAGRAEVKARALGTPQRWRYDDEALWLQTAMNRTSADGKPPRLIHQPLDGGSASTITLPFAPQRMEFLPKHLLLLAATDTHADEAARTDAYTVHRKTATPGEYVSFPGVAAEVHGRLASFNTVPWGDGSVLAGLPAAPRLQLDFGDADDHWYGGERPADLLVLRIVDGRLELGATVDFQKQQDDCTTHCVDWYGAARFFGFDNRAFGLSNNLLKELTVVDGRVRERAVLDLGGR